MLWICFWQQFIANIIWIMNINKENIIATVKWSAQFGPSVCSVKNMDDTNPVFSNALQWISSKKPNAKFTTAFTRTGHVDFDLLDNKWREQVVPLITDDVSWDTVWWGSKNGNILWVQFHPEISLHKLEDVRDEIEKVIHLLEIHYKKDIHHILDNFQLWEHVNKFNDIWEYFYTYVLDSFVQDILEKKVADYPEVTKKMIRKIKNKLNIMSFDDNQLFDPNERAKIIAVIDQNRKLELNYNIDRKVDRWLKTYSDIVWFKDLSQLTLAQKDYLQNLWYREPYFVCDLWAGNGTFIRELYENVKGNDISIYWVGDKICLDLYQWIMKSKFGKRIPKDIIQMLMGTLYMDYKDIDQKESLIKNIKSILGKMNINPESKFDIPFSCMEKDDVFITKQEKVLSKESKAFLLENQELIQELIDDIKDNIYDYFYGYFERIYISDFSSFQINENDINSIDMQVSVRSTSHLDDDEYKDVIINYIDNFANPGSFFIDNGVHRSYTNVPRLKQLRELELEYKKRINIKLVYDTKTNYFCSAIIETTPFHSTNFWEKQLGENKILVNVEDAEQSAFFKLETFIRNFIIINFKNYGVFWEHNDIIIECVNKCLELQKEWKYFEIQIKIVNLINEIIDNIHQIKYNKINIDILKSYQTTNGDNINQIVKEPFYMAEWIICDNKRKN